MSTLDPMVVPKALVLLPSNPLMMLATPFNNSTAMTGKAAHSRFVKIASLALVLDSVDEEASELGVVVVFGGGFRRSWRLRRSVEALVVASEVVEALVADFGGAAGGGAFDAGAPAAPPKPLH